ncbi:MAG: DUF177 domain-containing protein [Bacteroidota bacterium]
MRAERAAVDIFKLTTGKHHFSFEPGGSFFSGFSDELFRAPDVKVEVDLDKNDTMITAILALTGDVELTCDRSNDTFREPVSGTHRLVFKFGEEDEDVDDELSIIGRNTQKLDLSQAIYDFIALAVPVKKLHPRFRTDDIGGEGETGNENVLLIYSTSTAPDEDEEENKTPDPRWLALSALKNNKN